MKKAIPILVAFFWLGSGILGAGWLNAYWQKEDPILNTHRDRRKGLTMVIACGIMTGPVGMFMSFAVSGAGDDGWNLTLGDDVK
jgi:hypothetical protein